MSKEKDMGPAGGVYSRFVKMSPENERLAQLGQRVVGILRDWYPTGNTGKPFRDTEAALAIISAARSLGLLDEKETKP